MNQLHRLSPDDRADLVAYLDGELDDNETQRIENSLATNPVVRHEVEMLTRTWEMLDELPKETASEDFTAKTLSVIVVAEHQETLEEKQWYQNLKKNSIYVFWALGLVAASAIGYLVTSRFVPHESDPLIDDLPVIQKFDSYSEVKDTDYLIRLRKSGAFPKQSEGEDGSDNPIAP